MHPIVSVDLYSHFLITFPKISHLFFAHDHFYKSAAYFDTQWGPDSHLELLQKQLIFTILSSTVLICPLSPHLRIYLRLYHNIVRVAPWADCFNLLRCGICVVRWNMEYMLWSLSDRMQKRVLEFWDGGTEVAFLRNAMQLCILYFPCNKMNAWCLTKQVSSLQVEYVLSLLGCVEFKTIFTYSASGSYIGRAWDAL